MSFTSVLVANRGEIAVRVIRSAKKLGYQTIAVYSDADRSAMHVKMADRAIRLGEGPPRDSYLAIEKVVSAAKSCGRVAVHPGYGFLSENAAFARAVTDAGLVFIGPPASAVEAMGDKAQSKKRMIAAGVPCVPGYHGDDQSDACLAEEAKKIGFPVMVKASAGGGGRGMRLVTSDVGLEDSIRSARSEAESSFGNGTLLLEKAVVGARHVEIQVFGDTHGTVVHLGERDCSIQRRNQKVVEEAPSPAVDDALRIAMGNAAVLAARAVDYVGAGTVEFLLGEDGAFYFLEMNTRLQVEHPVTELVYGVDLVEWQLRIAAGERIPISQEMLLACRQGHAIEVRLCAENTDFIPDTGTVLRFAAPTGEGVRMDTFLEDGVVISPFYDSLLGKLIAYGADREEARRRLSTALAHTTVLGVTTNRDFLAAIVSTERFASGKFSTAFLEHESLKPDPALDTRHLALAALTFCLAEAEALRVRTGFCEQLAFFDSAELAATPLLLGSHRAHVRRRREGFRVDIAGQSFGWSAHVEGEIVRYVEDGLERTLRFVRDGDELFMDAEGRISRITDRTYAAVAGTEASDGAVRAPGAGKLLRLNVAVGAAVEKGATLAVVESMKLEIELKAPRTGTVSAVHVAAGDQVKAGKVLLEVKAVEEGTRA